MDLSIFTTPEAWISLLTLIFLEVVLGVDNLVFISITTNRTSAASWAWLAPWSCASCSCALPRIWCT